MLTGDHPDPPEWLHEVAIPSGTCNFGQFKVVGFESAPKNRKDLELRRSSTEHDSALVKRGRANGGQRSKSKIPARAPAAPARRRPFFLTMKLTPMKAEEATARSEPVRLAAKRSPPPLLPGSVASRLIGGVRRAAATRAFEAKTSGAKGLDLESRLQCLPLTGGGVRDGVWFGFRDSDGGSGTNVTA